MNTILDLETSNQYIINLIETNNNKPFIVSRLGTPEINLV